MVCCATMATAQTGKGMFSIKPMAGINDVGIPIGLSYEYKNVVLDVRYCFGLTKIDNTQDPEDTRNRTLSVTLGYNFKL